MNDAERRFFEAAEKANRPTVTSFTSMPQTSAAPAVAPVNQTLPVAGHVTIEKTGKKYKMQMALGCSMIALGLLFFMFTVVSASKATAIACGVFLLFGLILFAIGRVGSWWNHG